MRTKKKAFNWGLLPVLEGVQLESPVQPLSSLSKRCPFRKATKRFISTLLVIAVARGIQLPKFPPKVQLGMKPACGEWVIALCLQGNLNLLL